MPRRCELLLHRNKNLGPRCKNRGTRKRKTDAGTFTVWVCARCDERHKKLEKRQCSKS